MTIRIRPSITRLPLSATLRANQEANRITAAGNQVLHMGFGQSPFPVHPTLIDAVAVNAARNDYDHTAGVAELRQAAAHYFAPQMGIDADDYDVVVAPGSKLILYALQMAIDGDVIVPAPSWVSYAPQATMLGDTVVPVPADLSDDGYRIAPRNLTAAIGRAREAGQNPTKLILNSPNNPTGLVMPVADHKDLTQICRDEGILIISDEIYAQVSFDARQRSIAASWPEGVAVTTGLSKHLSLGGWRVGFGFIPKASPGLLDAMCAIASETWSCVAAPIQHAAVLALARREDIETWIALCTRIHSAVTRRAANILRGGGLRCAMPRGAFYLWPDFERFRSQLAGRGITTSESLASSLLREHQVLTLPGSEFGAEPHTLALRVSTCDYDGAHAMSVARECADLDTAVDEFAPRVVQGANALLDLVAAST